MGETMCERELLKVGAERGRLATGSTAVPSKS